MAKAKTVHSTFVVGGVDTHKDLHVAAVVDRNNRILGSEFFPTTRQGYRQMLTWWLLSEQLSVSVLNARVRMMQVFCATFRMLKSKFWRSPHQIKWNAVSRVKAIRSMQKVPLTLLSHAYAPPHQKRVAE